MAPSNASSRAPSRLVRGALAGCDGFLGKPLGLMSILDEESDRLERAMAQLPPRQRMLLKLRFQQDLTLKETARLARLGDPFKARREIQKALQRLESLLSR